jgi:hypothetical protein
MTELHGLSFYGAAQLALLGVVFLLSLLADSTNRRALPRWLWMTALVAAGLVLLQAGTGVALYAVGARPSAAHHPVYGLLASGFAVTVFFLRPGGRFRGDGGRLREGRVLVLISLSLIALILRAQATGAP